MEAVPFHRSCWRWLPTFWTEILWWEYPDVLGMEVSGLVSAYLKNFVSFCTSDLEKCSHVLQTRYLWLYREIQWFVLQKFTGNRDESQKCEQSLLVALTRICSMCNFQNQNRPCWPKYSPIQGLRLRCPGCHHLWGLFVPFQAQCSYLGGCKLCAGGYGWVQRSCE